MVKDEEALMHAADAINKGQVPKKIEKKEAKASKTKQENQSSNANSDRKELERWVKFVKENRLGIKDAKTGSVYLKVEAWNYLFAIKGLMATILDMSRYPDEDGKTLYIAKAALVPKEEKTKEFIGATAFGACKVDEGKGMFDNEFSALSMAQTRAVGKLGRTVFAHLAISCGYQACPWEELFSNTIVKEEK